MRSDQINDLAERSIRAEFALVMGVSENAAARELDHAQLLVEELRRTRALLADAKTRAPPVRWLSSRRPLTSAAGEAVRLVVELADLS